MDNEQSAAPLLEALDAYEKSRRRDAWVLAAIAWAAWIAVVWPGLASDTTSGAFMGISIAALARALQVQLRRSPEDRFLARVREIAAPTGEAS